MRVTMYSDPGNPQVPNEDWACTTAGLMVVLDGATVRTETGCRHGVPWFTRHLGAAIMGGASDCSRELPDVLSDAIQDVAEQHPECDLDHPGTPSAAVAVVRKSGSTLEYLGLGDVTVVLDRHESGLHVVEDDRVSKTAIDARSRADEYAIGSPEKAAALLQMKHGELAARNQPGGYWIAASNPAAAAHALTGTEDFASINRVALLSDGAARAVAFGLMDWTKALDVVAQQGPAALIRIVREAEASDPLGERWHRNKRRDDATVAYGEPAEEVGTG